MCILSLYKSKNDDYKANSKFTQLSYQPHSLRPDICKYYEKLGH